jgi:sorting nexin-4
VTDLDWSGVVKKLSSLWRRYSEFELLRTYLEVTYPYIVVPPLPEKKVMFAWQKAAADTFDPDFIDRRRAGLEVRRHIPNSGFIHFIKFRSF